VTDDASQTVNPLIQLHVACHLALDALPELPPETTQALRARFKSCATSRHENSILSIPSGARFTRPTREDP
jgi:hypothetical protein